jgi:Predicted membrane protein (DUF2335).
MTETNNSSVEVNDTPLSDNQIVKSDPKEAIEGVLERVAQTDPEAAARITNYIVQKIHHGPMPSPEDLQNYKLTQPDLPERMMKMAEISQQNKSKHADKVLELKDRELELNKIQIEKNDTAHSREIINQRLSLVAAFLIVLVCIIGSFILAWHDKTAVASIIGGTTVVGVVATFLKNKTSEKK